MSHVNYNGISNNAAKDENVKTADVTTTSNVIVDDLVDIMAVGKVSNCTKLNVRKDPDINADILFIIDKDTEVVIDNEESTEEWYKVIVNEQEGFCMKKYISLPQ